jgi:hypothetical protein
VTLASRKESNVKEKWQSRNTQTKEDKGTASGDIHDLSTISQNRATRRQEITPIYNIHIGSSSKLTLYEN